MDKPQSAYLDLQQSAADSELTESCLHESQPYVRRWNRLVSTTNWEKGCIILQWREALVAARAPATEYSDETWSRLVNGVTSQHVGRLRRVYQRFGQVYQQYDGLYWSHFQAALDWEDAEMWLEGAVQSGWSVSQLRRQRWETLGAIEQQRPRDEDLISNETDEDFEPAVNQHVTDNGQLDQMHSGPRLEGPDFGEPSDGDESAPRSGFEPQIESSLAESETVDFVRPFANLGELPDDLAEAFESFKLAILRHKTDGWQQISRGDLLAALDALKELAVAPSASETPF
jgi:hypothetical protein